MIFNKGFYFPESDTHFAQQMARCPIVHDRGTYQYYKLQKAMEYVRGRDCALDVGAHVGLWTYQLSFLFFKVHAFEPDAENIECFKKNIEKSNVTLHEYALGDKTSQAEIVGKEGNSGEKWLDFLPRTKGKNVANILRLDDCINEKVDFIKVDCEGFEHFVLSGGKRLIKEYKPVIIVEQNRFHQEKYGIKNLSAVTFLNSLGYQQKQVLYEDYIMVHQVKK